MSEAWQNIDNILNLLDTNKCCKNGYVNAPEDVVASLIRDWLRELKEIEVLIYKNRIDELEEKLATALAKLNNVYNIASESQVLNQLIMEEINK